MKSLADAMVDPALFGSTFAGPSFANWRTVAKVIDGLPLTSTEIELYSALTGRADTPAAPFTECYLVKPRRAGGTLFGAVCGVHAALQDYRDRLGPGEWATVALIASDRRQARQLMSYCKGLVHDSPLIAGELERETETELDFTHRTRIEVHVASFRSTRGYSYACVLLDELAFYRDDLSANPDVELVRAVRPGLANLGGRLLGFSSPHSRRGHLWDMYLAHYGKPSNILVLQAPGQVLNPTISKDVIARARQEDPTAARSEWDAQFREDVSQFLEDELIDAAVCEGRQELPYLYGRNYVAFCDPSGGRHDAMTLAVAHCESVSVNYAPRGRAVLDRLVVVVPPFDPETVVQRFSEVCRSFGIRTVVGDRFAAEWVSASFKKYGVKYEAAELDKSAIYVECLPLFAEQRVDLLDVKAMVTQLRLLERKPRSGGRGDAVDHPPRAHDDAANAACGALWLASRKPIAHRSGQSRPAFTLM